MPITQNERIRQLPIDMKQVNAHLYLISRLLKLIVVVFAIYHTAFYFLPKHIQEDQFSGIGELDMTINLTLVFSILYSGFIYWEYLKFKRKNEYKLKNAALVILIISLLIGFGMLFLIIRL